MYQESPLSPNEYRSRGGGVSVGLQASGRPPAVLVTASKPTTKLCRTLTDSSFLAIISGQLSFDTTYYLFTV